MLRRPGRLVPALVAACVLSSGSTVHAVSGPLSFKLNSAGDLTISGVPSGDIELTGTANDQLNVKEGGVSLGTFAVTRDLKVTLGDVAGALNVTADLGGFTMSGSWRVTIGDAIPGVTFKLQHGTILGAVKIKTGDGGDTVNFGTVGSISIHGKVDVDTGEGSDFVLSPSGGNDFGGDFTALNAQFVASDQPTHVAGNMTIKSTKEASGLTVALGIDIDRGVTIVGSKESDVVTFNENSTIGGNLKVTLRDGNDQLRLGSGIGASGNAAIGGKLVVSGGNDDDTVYLGSSGGDSATVAGDVTFSAGAGNDTMRIGTSAVSGKKVVVNGLGGNDTLLTTGVLTAPSADLRFQGGNDDDVVDFTVALPQLKSADLNGGRGTNTYLPNAAPVGYPLKVVNF